MAKIDIIMTTYNTTALAIVNSLSYIYLKSDISNDCTPIVFSITNPFIL